MKSLVFAAALAASLVSASAASAASTGFGIPGLFDPQTRIFVPQTSTGFGESRALASRSGTVSVAMTISIASSIPSATPILCALNITHAGPTGAAYVETATAVAKRSGSSATCTVKVPYLWAQADTSGIVMSQILVSADQRQLMHTLAPFTVPSNGATKSLKATLRF